jgi:type VI secretion system lysozyme-like protein
MRSLTKDIRAAATGTKQDPVRALREAVLEHLRDMCGTPRGTPLLPQDYGLEDVTRAFLEYPSSAMEMAQHLLDGIRRYEPRLANAEVSHVKADDSELRLRFDIEATLVSDGKTVPVRFSTIVDSDNRIELR